MLGGYSKLRGTTVEQKITNGAAFQIANPPPWDGRHVGFRSRDNFFRIPFSKPFHLIPISWGCISNSQSAILDVRHVGFKSRDYLFRIPDSKPFHLIPVSRGAFQIANSPSWMSAMLDLSHVTIFFVFLTANPFI